MFVIIVKEAMALLKKNMNLAQLIFIFYIIATLFAPMVMGVKLNFKAIPMLVLWYALFCSLFAGLFFAFKKALDYKTNPPNENSLGLSPLYFAEFLQGVGKYTTKFLLAGLIVLFLLLLLGMGYDFVIEHYVVLPQAFHQISSDILLSDSKMTEFINSLTLAEQIKLSKLSLFTLGVIALFGVLTMFYPVLLVSNEDNPFKSFIISLKYLFWNLPISLVIFFFFNIAITFASLISFSAGNNIIISIISILLQCYLNVLYILTLFVYYEKAK